MQLIEEFESKGSVESPYNASYKLRQKFRESLKLFNTGYNLAIGRTGAKYGTYDIFGKRLCFYYDARRDEEFVDFIVNKFFDKNPEPDKEIRKSFTRILHSHRLHWFDSGKTRYDW